MGTTLSMIFNGKMPCSILIVNCGKVSPTLYMLIQDYLSFLVIFSRIKD